MRNLWCIHLFYMNPFVDLRAAGVTSPTDTQLQSLLQQSASGTCTPQDRIRRRGTDPNISGDKASLPAHQKRRTVIRKVVKRVPQRPAGNSSTAATPNNMPPENKAAAPVETPQPPPEQPPPEQPLPEQPLPELPAPKQPVETTTKSEPGPVRVKQAPTEAAVGAAVAKAEKENQLKRSDARAQLASQMASPVPNTAPKHRGEKLFSDDESTPDTTADQSSLAPTQNTEDTAEPTPAEPEDAAEPAAATNKGSKRKKRRRKTVEEKAIHARYMRFSRQICSLAIWGC